MKAILLLIPLSAGVSCAMPTTVGDDYAVDQFHVGGRAALTTSTSLGDSESGGYILGDSFSLSAGMFVTDKLELGGATEFWTYPDEGNAKADLLTGYARYYIQNEGNIRPFVLLGAGMYSNDRGTGDVFRFGAGVSQFVTDTTSFELSAEQHFSTFVLEDDRTTKEEADTVNIYFGFNILL
ncbi:MAG: outer membrane beta-barrel protein [Planctomycetes bacterium]|nr:outer membrane beta-barrel protein [Planctomycetota bacterium]